jgi:ABC-type multidrug transport system fused ATPase/permease subunit
MEQNFYVIGFLISFILNAIFIIMLVATKAGKESVTRFFNKLRYQKGGYVNGLKFFKDGNVKEVFVKKKEDNSVHIGNEMHTVNPVLLRNYKNFPTQIYIEGNLAPVDIFKDHIDLQSITDEEVNKIILSNTDGMSLFKWVANNAVLFLFLLGLFALIAGAGLYFNYQIYDALVQAGISIGNNVAVPNGVEIVGEVLTQK